jgi:hypothetical protein
MIYIYKYLFYRLYSFIYKYNKKINPFLAAHNSIVLMSFLMALNINSLYRLLLQLFKFQYNKIIPLTSYVLIYLFNMYLFLKVFNYLKLTDEFINESENAKIISMLLTIIFVIISLLPLIIKIAT